jgi:hypothetical protein
MRKRCSDISYKHYAGRGIRVCEEWMTFTAFQDWALAQPTYEVGKQIDRVENGGNYEPSNCRWATPKENARNTSRTRWITIDGETKSLAEWCEIYEVDYHLVYYRLMRNWNILIALTKEKRKSNEKQK